MKMNVSYISIIIGLFVSFLLLTITLCQRYFDYYIANIFINIITILIIVFGLVMNIKLNQKRVKSRNVGVYFKSNLYLIFTIMFVLIISSYFFDIYSEIVNLGVGYLIILFCLLVLSYVVAVIVLKIGSVSKKLIDEK